MNNDAAVFLDLDNLAIGTKQANLVFDINLILDHIKEITNGRIVYRYACGGAQQNQGLMQELAQTGFHVQSATPLNSYNKNLADMQIVVNAMETLLDGHNYNTYVLLSGDRDFTPLVQSLRKRGKYVVGVGVKHTTSASLVELCDQYVFYEDIIPQKTSGNLDTGQLLEKALADVLRHKNRERASVLTQRMMDLSKGAFDRSAYPESTFRKFLERFPHLVQIEQDDTTIYVKQPETLLERPLHQLYRSGLKKQRLRIVLPPKSRLLLLRKIINIVTQNPQLKWRELLDSISYEVSNEALNISKNLINSALLVARQSGIICTLKASSLSMAPVVLEINGTQIFQEAVLMCDRTYLQAILNLPEPFDIEEAAIALYEKADYAPYLKQQLNALGANN
ncbi:MAG: NYN domain-containing protein [Anaerolineales bacterium]|nr:NYN domain-containing protein [Anaerolineales bacterium]